MGKVIIGFIGDKNLISKLTPELSLRGFEIFSIKEKVKEMARHVLPGEEVEKEIVLKKFRDKGCKVHRSYWINIFLMAIPKQSDKVVIIDMEEEDALPQVIRTFRVTKENFETVKKEIDDIICNYKL